MPHALTVFIRQQMDERGYRNRDVEQRSGLSRSHVSKLVRDDRDNLARLPDRATMEGLARAFHVSIDLVLGRAIEALGLGFTSADFVNEVRQASNDELLDELRRRLAGEAGLAAVATVTDLRPPDSPSSAAARDIGGRSPGQQRRDRADQAGEPPTDDPGDLEPR